MYAAFSVYPDEAAVAARAALPSLTRGGGGGGESRVFFFSCVYIPWRSEQRHTHTHAHQVIV